jgi:hypothetical protein
MIMGKEDSAEKKPIDRGKGTERIGGGTQMIKSLERNFSPKLEYYDLALLRI